MTVLRWLLLPIVLAALVAGAVLAGQTYVAQAAADCKSAIGGACVEGWHTTVIERVIYAGAVVTPVVMVLLGSALAPALKRTVAVVAGLSCTALLVAGFWFTNWRELLSPAMVAAAAGGLAALWVGFRQRHRTA